MTSYPIELLWLIPIVVVAGMVFAAVMFFQRHSVTLQPSSHGGSVGDPLSPPPPPTALIVPANDFAEKRLGDIEMKIGVLTGALSEQQQVIEKFQRENVTYVRQVNDLKKRLNDLHREYDLVVSENFSLKARVKKLSREPIANTPAPPNGAAAVHADVPSAGRRGGNGHRGDEVNRRMYGDTRVMKAIDLDDTKEMDLSELAE